MELSDSQKKILDIISMQSVSQNTKDEMDADLRALEIYLGLGYSATDAENAFLKVFNNKNRYKSLMKFIKEHKNV